MKRTLTLVLALVLVMIAASQGTAYGAAPVPAQKPIAVNVNGQFIATDVSPTIVHGRVLVPLRALASLGLTYRWDSKTRTATITDDDGNEVQMTANQKIATKNGTDLSLDVPAAVVHGRMVVPIRFLTDAFGFQAQYEKTRVMLFVQSKDYTPNLDALNSSDLREARLAAISLPLHFSFAPTAVSQQNDSIIHDYYFPYGESDKYLYSNGRAYTWVEVKDGIASAVWQFQIGKSDGDYFDEAGTRPEPKWYDVFTIYMNWTKDNDVSCTYFEGQNAKHIKVLNVQSEADMIQLIPGETRAAGQ